MLRAHGLDALLVFSPARVRYLTGFTGSSGLAVIGDRRGWLLTDGRYALQSTQEVSAVRCIIAGGGLVDEMAGRGLLKGVGSVGFEAEDLTFAVHRNLRKRLPGVTLVPTSGLVEDLMVVKEPEELALIREAIGISEYVFREVLALIAPGVSELELVGRISALHRRYGAEGDAFEPIVASGPRSALPHARASSRRIRKGDLVTLDLGCVRGGYSSDITRTVAVESLSSRLRRIYQAVYEAGQAAVDQARGGLDARALDAVARRVITRHGFGKYFVHSLGHGLGLQVHERPRISSRSKDRLCAGSVVTIEPGVYVQDIGGVRIEDDVLLKEQGCEVLTSVPRELLIV